MKYKIRDVLLALLFIVPHSHISKGEKTPPAISVSVDDLTILVNGNEHFNLQLITQLSENVNVTFIKSEASFIDISPTWIYLNAEENNKISTINVKGLHPGRLTVTAETIPRIVQNISIQVTVCISRIIYYVSIIVGWIYFVAWSISFYPQIITNYRRKSVVGLNFDFVSLNFLGFILYSIFNVGLYWIIEIQNEYIKRNPRGISPVFANDVFFSLHAVFATTVIIVQCFKYERADQKVSFIAIVILTIFSIVITISAGMAIDAEIEWLDFLYYCSYIKLSITLIKYIPQAVMNYRRKSTVGWSIGNILLDFIGGTLSMVQMMLNAYNYDDWTSIFGDPTKFGLGLFSVCFDIFFMLQHYVFYRNNQPYEEIPGEITNTENELDATLVPAEQMV